MTHPEGPRYPHTVSRHCEQKACREDREPSAISHQPREQASDTRLRPLTASAASPYRELASPYRELASPYRELASRYRELASRYRERASRYRELASRYRERSEPQVLPSQSACIAPYTPPSRTRSEWVPSWTISPVSKTITRSEASAVESL